MKKVLSVITGPVVVAAVSLALPLVAAAVGTNGSFETGTAPGVYLTLSAGDTTSITDWSVDSGSVDYIGSYWQASDGSRSIDLNGLTTGSISQTIPTVVGATYDVTFDLSGNPASRSDVNDPYWSPSLKDIQVSATGASSQDFTFDTAAKGNSLGDMKWGSHTYSFVANQTSTTLTFASMIPGAFGPALDNVAIVETLPPPQFGTLKVIKKTIGGEDMEFHFTGTGVLGAFKIHVDDNKGSKTFKDVPVGTYTVTEQLPASWTQTGNTCENVVVAPNTTTTCTITNTKLHGKAGEHGDKDKDGRHDDGHGDHDQKGNDN